VDDRRQRGRVRRALALPALAIRALQFATKDAAPGDVLVYAPTDADAAAGQPLKASDLAVGFGTQAFPAEKSDNSNNLIEVVRVGEGDAGLVAYSAICTHLGCAVYADLNQKDSSPAPATPASSPRPRGRRSSAVRRRGPCPPSRCRLMATATSSSPAPFPARSVPSSIRPPPEERP
jgi:hypothetical protein